MSDASENDDPAAEVGADDCDATADECEDGVVEDDHKQVIEFTAQDELEAPFEPHDLPSPIGEDGLPRNDAEPHDQGVAPPFTYDTVVCVEDDRVYVELWKDELNNDRREYLVWHLPSDFRYRVRDRYAENGDERDRREFQPDTVKRLFGGLYAQPGGEALPAELIPVRPVRERCRFYKRQVFADMAYKPGELGHQKLYRNCTARRSTGGAFLGLRDEGVYMCDYRSPRDERTERHQDLIDADKLRTKPHMRLVPLFGLPGEERQLAVDPFDGIFSKKV